MIVDEIVNGLCVHYSDEDRWLVQYRKNADGSKGEATNAKYQRATDVVPCRYVYEEGEVMETEPIIEPSAEGVE